MVPKMDTQGHWERIYGTKAPTEKALIERVTGDPAASIIDVGGGESSLVDDLVSEAYRNITVMDIYGHADTEGSGANFSCSIL
jgi:hypothetical protein